MSARHPIVLPPAPRGRPGRPASGRGCRDMHDDPGAVPRDLDIVAAADETGDDAEKHLAGLVLLEGELGDPVQPSPDLDQVKHGPLR